MPTEIVTETITEGLLTLPTMEELPSEYDGEEALPDEYHALLALLLMETFRPPRHWPDRCFSALDMYLYYEARPVLHGLRPDWFGVVGVPRLRGGDQRTSYAVWEEGVGPLVVVEALSRGTREGDVGRGALPPVGAPRKWDVYEKRLRVPYYVTVDHHQRPAEVTFYRHDGEGFREVGGVERRMWMAEAGLGVGVWRGVYAGLRREWVRFYDATGAWIPTGEERVRQERRARLAERRARLEAQKREKQERRARLAEQEAKEAALERERREREAKERLAAKLRELGFDPDAL